MASNKKYLDFVLEQLSELELPYEGEKEMLLGDNVENSFDIASKV